MMSHQHHHQHFLFSLKIKNTKNIKNEEHNMVNILLPEVYPLVLTHLKEIQQSKVRQLNHTSAILPPRDTQLQKAIPLKQDILQVAVILLCKAHRLGSYHDGYSEKAFQAETFTSREG